MSVDLKNNYAAIFKIQNFKFIIQLFELAKVI